MQKLLLGATASALIMGLVSAADAQLRRQPPTTDTYPYPYQARPQPPAKDTYPYPYQARPQPPTTDTYPYPGRPQPPAASKRGSATKRK
jgi:hypothetical protein